MLVRNLRTGFVGEVKDSLAKALIANGKCEEVKPEKKAEEQKPSKKTKKNEYKTKDMKAES